MKSLSIFALLAVVWFGAGCATRPTIASRKQERAAAYAALSPEFKSAVDQGQIKGGDLVTAYLNKYSMDGAQSIPVRLHPNMPPGTVLFTTSTIPYPLSNVANVLQMRMRQDFFAIEWPRRTRKYEYGIYADGVLQNYFPPAFGLITNITNG